MIEDCRREPQLGENCYFVEVSTGNLNTLYEGLMCQFQKNDSGDNKKDSEDPHRTYGVAVEKNAQNKCSCSTNPGPDGIGGTHGNIPLGKIK